MSIYNIVINHQRQVLAMKAIFRLNTKSYRKYIYIYYNAMNVMDEISSHINWRCYKMY